MVTPASGGRGIIPQASAAGERQRHGATRCHTARAATKPLRPFLADWPRTARCRCGASGAASARGAAFPVRPTPCSQGSAQRRSGSCAQYTRRPFVRGVRRHGTPSTLHQTGHSALTSTAPLSAMHPSSVYQFSPHSFAHARQSGPFAPVLHRLVLARRARPRARDHARGRARDTDRRVRCGADRGDRVGPPRPAPLRWAVVAEPRPVSRRPGLRRRGGDRTAGRVLRRDARRGRLENDQRRRHVVPGVRQHPCGLLDRRRRGRALGPERRVCRDRRHGDRWRHQRGQWRLRVARRGADLAAHGARGIETDPFDSRRSAGRQHAARRRTGRPAHAQRCARRVSEHGRRCDVVADAVHRRSHRNSEARPRE